MGIFNCCFAGGNRSRSGSVCEEAPLLNQNSAADKAKSSCCSRIWKCIRCVCNSLTHPLTIGPLGVGAIIAGIKVLAVGTLFGAAPVAGAICVTVGGMLVLGTIVSCAIRTYGGS